MKKPYLYAGIGIIVVLVFAFVMIQRNTTPSSPELSGLVAEVFYSPTCGCCINYMGSLREAGITVKATQVTDMDTIKNDLNIPTDMRSCHTTKIGDYFVEGHIPVEAIQKLIAEKPLIDGIALPGMPSGSPGMPGIKRGTFDVQSINNGKSEGLFVQI